MKNNKNKHVKLHLLDRASTDNRSFTVKRNRYAHFLKVWHYHPELELVMIEKSTGTRFIGDSIHKFEPGDVVLIGSNLPHMWLNDPSYHDEGNTLEAQALTAHFTYGFLGDVFFERPEFALVKNLLQKARRGIRFRGLPGTFHQRFENLLNSKGFHRTIAFLNLLYDLAEAETQEVLASPGYLADFQRTKNRQLDKIYKFVYDNFKSPIQSKDVAEAIFMNPSSFSRYFKRMHQKTFTRYLNEIRVGYACKLLIEESYSVSEACFESGFGNVSNFNRQFKCIVGKTPTGYVKDFKVRHQDY